MQLWVVLFAWCINVFVLSLALAIFEILIEKENGWASAIGPRGVGRRLFGGSIIATICEKPYLTAYHLLVFVFILPLILSSELLLLKSMVAANPGFGSLFVSPAAYLVMKVGGVTLIPLLFLIAAWLSVLVVEDFLWFLLNWYYPRSLDDLLSGKIWWHTRWLTVGSIKLPRFYLTTALGAALLLAASFSPGLLSVSASGLK